MLKKLSQIKKIPVLLFTMLILLSVSPAVQAAPRLNLPVITLVEGERFPLTIIGKPDRTKAVWTSSKKSIATVSSRGNITAKKAGLTTISCTLSKGSKRIIKLTALVTVFPKPIPASITELQFISDGDFIPGEGDAKMIFKIDKKATKIYAEILNEEKKVIRTLNSESKEAGTYTMFWDGLDNTKSKVSEGNYKVCLHVDKKKKTSRILKAKINDFSKGNGSKENPYQIWKAEDLDAIRTHNTCYFIQMQDITLQDAFEPLFTSRKKFEGSYDGKEHSITGLEIDNGRKYHTAMFTAIGIQGTVQNLFLKDCAILGGKNSAGLAGLNEGVINNCHVTGKIDGKEGSGGICGENLGVIKQSSSNIILAGEKKGEDSSTITEEY